MKTHAAILFFQALIGIGLLMASSYPKTRDNDRKAVLESALSLPRTSAQIAALSDQTIIKQFDSEVASLKNDYWNYLKEEDRANEGARAAALLLIVSALVHSLVIYTRTRNRNEE